MAMWSWTGTGVSTIAQKALPAGMKLVRELVSTPNGMEVVEKVVKATAKAA